jgi:hypothetical protein
VSCHDAVIGIIRFVKPAAKYPQLVVPFSIYGRTQEKIAYTSKEVTSMRVLCGMGPLYFVKKKDISPFSFWKFELQS